MVDLLRDLGCAEAVAVRDADSAFGQLEFRSPRIVLCAARGPDFDGFQFVRDMRRSRAVRNNETSTVLTFVGVERADILTALNAGADAILSFPLSRSALETMLGLLDTQKRPFVRAASYVGPCRRRGMVGEEGGRRLEDFGAPEALASMMAALHLLFDTAQRRDPTDVIVPETAASLAAFLREARKGRALDDAALSAQCGALVRQFADHAPGQKSFDHAFAPLRKLLTTVVLKGVAPARSKAA